MAADPALEQRPTGIRWWIFGLGCAISWLLYLQRYAWGVTKKDFKDEHPAFGDRDMGWLDSAFMATYAFGQIPLGVAGDFFGPRTLMAVLVLFMSIAVTLVAWAGGFWWYFLVRLVLGFFQAGVYPLLSKITRTWFPLAYRTIVQGVVTSLGRVGGACAPFIVATVLMDYSHLSWQDSMLTIAAPGILLALAFWFTFRNQPNEHPWVNAAECRVIGADAAVPGAVIAAPVKLRLTADNRLSFFMLLGYAFTSTFADMLYVFWIPQFLREAKGMSTAEMGQFAPLPLLGGAIGGLLAGALNDMCINATGSRRWSRTAVAFTGKTLAAIMIAVSVQAEDGRIVAVFLLATKFFGDWSLPTQWGTITDISGRAAGTVFAVVNTIGGIAAFIASPIMAEVKEQSGWDGLFYFVAAIYFMAATCWLFIDCTKRLDVNE
jgi:ACS family glucarate transporter-like MFS transporter